MMKRLVQFVVGLAAVLLPTVTAAGCSIALALTVDVSGSINEREYRLQMDGLAAALRDPAVADALVSSEVALMLVQWSGASRQEVSVPWRRMLSQSDVEDFADLAEATPRAWAVFSTGIGNALLFTSAQFGEVADCEHKVIDVSGDGYSNEGSEPLDIAQALALQGFQINGLAIEGDEFELTEYYKHNVVAGEAAFVFTAETYADYPRTIWRKLLSELIIPIS
jgi:Ca-activated chloride channel family protein